jgi:hypothetical protein
MIAVVPAGLLLLALVDGACAGFRSSAGRSGLINHRSSDRRAARRGTTLVAILLIPAVTLTCVATVLHPFRIGLYLHAGEIMLAVYAPYGMAVLAALAIYATLDWRKRYLASAVILGPFTLLRPAVVILGAILTIAVARDAWITITVILAVVGVLAAEPVADRLWYAPRRKRDIGSWQAG